MSEQNVDAVRSAWEAFARHEGEAIFPLSGPDVEILCASKAEALEAAGLGAPR